MQPAPAFQASLLFFAFAPLPDSLLTTSLNHDVCQYFWQMVGGGTKSKPAYFFTLDPVPPPPASLPPSLSFFQFSLSFLPPPQLFEESLFPCFFCLGVEPSLLSGVDELLFHPIDSLTSLPSLDRGCFVGLFTRAYITIRRSLIWTSPPGSSY